MDAIGTAPYPPGKLIASVGFESSDKIKRLEKGSDNWPMTWGDDDQLYTAYGDGWGFDPKVDFKLSLGLAAIRGDAPDVTAYNIRSWSAERVGEGKYGVKVSGMLMVDGVLYMLVRNISNAQLGWSRDHGKSWTWADWKFETSFGCPAFLNYGKNYADAPDGFVYVYSHDEGSAYAVSDQMVLARVHKDKIASQDDYEFYSGTDAEGNPIWLSDIARRKSVFNNPGRFFRSSVSYDSGIKRYLMVQVMPAVPKAGEELDSRFKGGLGIYEAPTPWGPWATVFYSLQWDVGPGDTASIPTKWISKDGLTGYLVFSGDDSFSLRKVRFRLH